jgi:hypothetical protein
MRINIENKTIDIEQRDINFILPAYLRNYLFYSNNEMPDRIVFPMFESVPNGVGGVVQIEFIPYLDPAAIEIAFDGSNIAEVTDTQLAELESKDLEIERLKAQLAGVQTVEPEEVKVDVTEEKTVIPTASGIVVPTLDPGRIPNSPPGGDIGTGSADIGGSRDLRADRQIRVDLTDDDLDIDDEKEKPYDYEIKES